MRALSISLFISLLALAGCQTSTHDDMHHDEGHHDVGHHEDGHSDADTGVVPDKPDEHAGDEPRGHAHPEGTPEDHGHDDGVALLYRCEEHRDVIKAQPGRCPHCQKHLKPERAEE